MNSLKSRSNSVRGRRSLSSRMIRFKATACCPTDCRTPAASLITTKANIAEIPKATELKPWLKATDVARAVTTAECELGIPPLINK